jgi:uncharacterized surface protein with fasciclin (FAS1) repeats
LVLAVNAEGPNAGAFDTLIAALLVSKSTVVKKLSGKKEYTVFGPTDDAFADLGFTPTSTTTDFDFHFDPVLITT